MEILRTVGEARKFHVCSLVPTMGALHHGHAALLREAKRFEDPVVASIFVNPKQFAPGEDFDLYPRPVEHDLALCEAEGVAAVFMPSVEEVYSQEVRTITADPQISSCMCGKSRPGHFDGVTTVVARLFGILEPRRAFFGWKDAQQVLIIRRMIADLEMKVELVPVETVREEDGLAMSSRNSYLSREDRAIAPELYRALRKGRDAAMEGAAAKEITGRVRKQLSVHGFETDYVDLRELDTLRLVEDHLTVSRMPTEVILAAAARLNRTRLIDNLRWRPDTWRFNASRLVSGGVLTRGVLTRDGI